MSFNYYSSQPTAGESPSVRSQLWRRYRKAARGGVVENELVAQYLPLVKTVVGRLAMTLPSHVDAENLHSAGLVGLLNAVRQFDPKLGTAFESYARLRIRGAVLDELRRMDWVPRSVHLKARQIEAAMRELEQARGRIPTDEEMAAALKLTPSEYEQWLDDVRPAAFLSLDAASPSGIDGHGRYESIEDQTQENPMAGTSRRELTRLIAQRLAQLPEMQRRVLALYYFEDLRLREIAEVFGLTESRICQIHAKAVLAIRASLHKLDPCLS